MKSKKSFHINKTSRYAKIYGNTLNKHPQTRDSHIKTRCAKKLIRKYVPSAKKKNTTYIIDRYINPYRKNTNLKHKYAMSKRRSSL